MNPAAALAVTMLAAGAATAGSARDLPDGMRARGGAILAAGGDSQAALAEGRSLLAAANPVQAIAAFRTALAADPRSLAALNGLGVAYDQLGRADLARQQFETALSIDPTASDIAYNLGWTLLKAGQHRAAIAPLQRAAAGADAQAAAAARRALAMVAARLEAPPPPEMPAPVQVAEARIDMVASGEAVLVLAPPQRLAAAAPRPADIRPAVDKAPVAGAERAAPPAQPVMAVLSQRLGDAAALTVPAVLLPAAAQASDQPVPRMIVLGDRPPEPPPLPAMPSPPPVAPPAPAEPGAPPPVVATVSILPGPRQPAAPAMAVQLAWHGRMAGSWALASRPGARADWHTAAPPAIPAAPADPRDRVRMAIARLERLLSLIEAARA